MATTVKKQVLDKVHVLYNNIILLCPNPRQIQFLSSWI